MKNKGVIIVTKYIGNAFSINMIPEDGLLSVKTITKAQFIKAGNHSKSIIGHPEIAKLFGLPLNRESITLKKGDMLYVVMPQNRQKVDEIVPSGTTYEFVPESEGYTYKVLQVLDK